MSPYLRITGHDRARSITILAVVVAAFSSLLLTASGSEARSLKSSVHPRLLLGISGNQARFEAQTGQDSSVAHAFLGWNQGLSWGLPFRASFPNLAPIPMLHLGTKGQNALEAITPAEIATGDGDSYLLALNHEIAVWGKGMYVRPMGEMNNANNFYAAYNANGQARSAEHSTTNYKKAFARIYLILHGGSAAAVNTKLKALGIPPLKPGVELRDNPSPSLRIVWSPLASDNPRVPGNAAEQYYPGAGYVDVEGGDIYEEGRGDTAPWAGLEKLYANAMARNKPFSVPEWGLDTVDDPAFVRHMCTFLKTHSPTETAIFYESKPGSSFDLEPMPESRAAYRECITPLAGKTYPAWAAANAPGGGTQLVGLSLAPDPPSGTSPLEVEFSISAKLSVPVAHWQVLFGDGSDAEGSGLPPATLVHTYRGKGIYHAVLFVYRAPPFAPEDTQYFTAADVSVGNEPDALVSVTPTPASGKLPLVVSFLTKLDIPDRATGWTMTFGDGLARQEAGPPPRFSGHTFTRAGNYCVLLIVNSTGGRRYAAVTEVVAGGGGGDGGCPAAPILPPEGTSKGDVLLNGKPFEGGEVPFGSKLDVTDGSLVLKTDGGKMKLYGEDGLPAKFKLTKGTDKGKQIFVLVLDGGNFSCPNRKTSSANATTAISKKPIRQLWGSGKGRFRTKGRFAAATVRGTIWLTTDRCDGTLITVRKGVVEVKGNKSKDPKTVKAGQSHLVPAR